MDIPTLKETLKDVNLDCEAEMNELKNTYNEDIQWLSGISSEIDKHISESHYLIPKAPPFKRKSRKKCLVETIPEHGELDISCSLQNLLSTSTSFDTRITRSTHAHNGNQSSVVMSPVLSIRSRRQASKAADARIKHQLSLSMKVKMRQIADVGSDVATHEMKCVSSHGGPDEDERPCKSRLVEQDQSVCPQDEQHENGSVTEVQEINGFCTSGRNASELKSSPLLKKLSVRCVAIETHNIRSMEGEIIKCSPNHVTSSVHDDCLPIREDRKKSRTESPVSSAAIEMSDDLSASPSVSVESAEDVCPKNSVRISYAYEVDELTCNEPQTKETHVLFPSDALSGINENSKPARKGVSVCRKSGTEASVIVTENFADKVHQNSIVKNMSEKQTSITEVGKTGPNETCSEAPHNNSASAEVDGQNVANEVLKYEVMSHAGPALDSSPVKEMVQLEKSTQMFRPVACEPAKECVVVLERLATVSEESAEQIVEKEPEQTMRVTRTKTRAISKAAAAAAAATSPDVSGISTELSKSMQSQSKWQVSQKSAAIAKTIPLAKQNRELDTVEEQESSKENSMTSVSGPKFTTPRGLHFYEKFRKTPLSAYNISNTSAHSSSRNCAVGCLSKGRFPTNKPAGNTVVGIESFITKHTLKPTLEDIQEKKEEEIKRRIEKKEEAKKKREQKVKEHVEEKKRKREEKMLKVLKKTREVHEKQKKHAEQRVQKKQEKLKQVMQKREDKIKEHVQQKKQHAQKKAAEIEERRKQEEATRMAKRKEQEEEQCRLQAERKREQEEAGRQNVERSAIEKQVARFREQQTAKMAQMQATVMKEKNTNEKNETDVKAAPDRAAILDRTFTMPPPSSSSDEFNPPKKIVNVDDYGIDSSGESSEDEEGPKRPVPHWARKVKRMESLKIQASVPREIYYAYFTCEETTPDLVKMLGVRCVKRTSSAVWRTPPRLSTS